MLAVQWRGARVRAGAFSANHSLLVSKAHRQPVSGAPEWSPTTKLTAVELQHGSEEGVVAKTDVAHPKLAHGERSELVGQVSVPAREARLGGQRQMGHHRRFFLRVRTVLSERKSYMYISGRLGADRSTGQPTLGAPAVSEKCRQ